MDGTKPIFDVITDSETRKGCIAFSFEVYLHPTLNQYKQGAAQLCEDEIEGVDIYRTIKLPFMCQKFADQSSSAYVY